VRSKISFSSYVDDIIYNMEKKYKQIQEVEKQLITFLRSRENEQRRGEDEVWEKIEKGLASKKRLSLKQRIYIWSTAAAAVFIFLFFFIEYKLSDDLNSLDEYVALLEEPVLESSQIQVYLSSQDKITVEENTASVTYSSKGNVLINEEKQETDSLGKVEQEYNQIVVPKGKYTHLTLSDGSTVHINSGTRVVYPRVFSGNHREIYVEGEVCLHVTKNEKFPFVVKTALFAVEVLGTTFNVSAYKNDQNNEVVLVNGSVRLSDRNKNKIELKPDQLAAINNGKIDAVKKVEALDYIAWTDGLLILQFEPLSNVFKKLERFYGVTINVSPEASLLKMRGKIDLKQSLDDLIVLISSTAPIVWAKTDEGYSIYKKER